MTDLGRCCSLRACAVGHLPLLVVVVLLLITAHAGAAAPTPVRSGYFHALTYGDSVCSSPTALMTAKIHALGVCYRSLHGYTLNTAYLDFPSVGIATLNSSYYKDAVCSLPASSAATRTPTTCTAGTSGSGGYYSVALVAPTALSYPATTCALITRAYTYANCSGLLLQVHSLLSRVCLSHDACFTSTPPLSHCHL